MGDTACGTSLLVGMQGMHTNWSSKREELIVVDVVSPGTQRCRQPWNSTMSTLLRCNLLSCLSCSLCILSRRPERYTHSLQPSNIYQTNGVPTCKPLHCSEMKHKKKVVRAHVCTVCASIHEAAQSWKRQWLSRRTIKSRLTVLRILGALTVDLSPGACQSKSLQSDGSPDPGCPDFLNQ